MGGDKDMGLYLRGVPAYLSQQPLLAGLHQAFASESQAPSTNPSLSFHICRVNLFYNLGLPEQTHIELLKDATSKQDVLEQLEARHAPSKQLGQGLTALHSE